MLTIDQATDLCGRLTAAMTVDRPAPAPPAPGPTYCEIHQHAKWCEHNGGVMGATGWEAPAPGLDLEAIERAEPITDEQLTAWRAVAAAASPNDLQYGASIGDGRAFALDCFDKGPPGPVHTVWFGEPHDAMVVAITGNGPTSEANAKHIAWSSPRNVIALIAEVRALRARLFINPQGAAQVLRQIVDARDAELHRLTAEADGLRAEVARLTAESDETNKILEESVADWERRVACASNICAHCKEPHTSEEMSVHVAACPRSPIVAKLAEAKRIAEEALDIDPRDPDDAEIVENLRVRLEAL